MASAITREPDQTLQRTLVGVLLYLGCPATGAYDLHAVVQDFVRLRELSRAGSFLRIDWVPPLTVCSFPDESVDVINAVRLPLLLMMGSAICFDELS